MKGRQTVGSLVFWIAVLFIGVAGVTASVNSLRFGRRVARDVERMFTPAVDPHALDRQKLDALPPPVRRYLVKALGSRPRTVRTVRIRQEGSFRTKLDGGWLPIQADQYFAADPPGFVWWGRVRAAPAIWVDAHDRSVNAVANMFVSLESTVTLADSTGPQLDQSALQRLLGELTWLPTVFLDDQHVTWQAIDDHHARATLRVNQREAVGLFEFGEDDLPTVFSADRFRDLGQGKSVLTPFTGECSDYRPIDGLIVPHQVTGYWHVDGQRIPFIRLHVKRLEFDATTPFQ